MIKFISKLLSFLTIVVIVWVLLYQISKNINDRYFQMEYQDINTLILGDSHTKYLNESILPNSENLSYEGESFKEVYYKLKYFDQFNDVYNIILGMSYHNFTNLAEQKIVKDYHSINRISPIVGVAELYRSTDNFKEFVNVAVRLHYPKMLTAFLRKKGGDKTDCRASVLDKHIKYRTVDQMKKKPKRSVNCKKFVEKRINKHYRYNDVENQTSKNSEKYLDLIIQYCGEHNIKLIAVNMPLHPCYRNKVPKYYINNLSRIERKYKDRPYFTLLDYSSKFDENKEYFRDPDHCTEYGSHLITTELKKYLKR